MQQFSWYLYGWDTHVSKLNHLRLILSFSELKLEVTTFRGTCCFYIGSAKCRQQFLRNVGKHARLHGRVTKRRENLRGPQFRSQLWKHNDDNGICAWLATGAVGETITDRCWRNDDGLQKLRWRLRLVGIRPETWTGTYWMWRRGASHDDSSALNCPLGLPSDTWYSICRKLEFSSPCVGQLPTSSCSSFPSIWMLSLLSFFYRVSSLFLTSAAVRQ